MPKQCITTTPVVLENSFVSISPRVVSLREGRSLTVSYYSSCDIMTCTLCMFSNNGPKSNWFELSPRFLVIILVYFNQF